MVGEAITKVNDEVIPDKDHFFGIVDAYAGQEVILTTFRYGAERSVRLRLNPRLD